MHYPTTPCATQNTQDNTSFVETLQSLESQSFVFGVLLLSGAAIGFTSKLIYDQWVSNPTETTTPVGNTHSVDFLDPNNELHDTNDQVLSPKAISQLSETITNNGTAPNTTDNVHLEAIESMGAKEICSQQLGRLDTFLSSRFVFDDLGMYTPTTDTALKSCIEGIQASTLQQPELFELVLQSIPFMVCADYVVETLKAHLGTKFVLDINNEQLQQQLEQTAYLREEKHALFRLFSTAVDPRKLKAIVDSPTKTVFKQALHARKADFAKFLNSTTQQRGNWNIRFNKRN